MKTRRLIAILLLLCLALAETKKIGHATHKVVDKVTKHKHHNNNKKPAKHDDLVPIEVEDEDLVPE